MQKTILAEKIKQVREDRKLSQEELSDLANVNLKLIKDIEEGNSVPSLTPLTKIARGLGVRLGTFLDDTSINDPIIVKNGVTNNVIYFSGDEEETHRACLEYNSLGAGKIDRHMEPFIIDVKLQGEEHELSAHEGEEFIYVLEGSIELFYGDEKHVAEVGDSLYYNCIVPHHLHAYGQPAKILAVIYTPIA